MSAMDLLLFREDTYSEASLATAISVIIESALTIFGHTSSARVFESH